MSDASMMSSVNLRFLDLLIAMVPRVMRRTRPTRPDRPKTTPSRGLFSKKDLLAAVEDAADDDADVSTTAEPNEVTVTTWPAEVDKNIVVVGVKLSLGELVDDDDDKRVGVDCTGKGVPEELVKAVTEDVEVDEEVDEVVEVEEVVGELEDVLEAVLDESD